MCGTDIVAARPEAQKEGDRLGEGQSEVTDMLINLLHAPVKPSAISGGVYNGEGLAPVPRKMAKKIWQREFVDMGELLPEFWVQTGEGKSGLPQSRVRVIAEIFIWIQGSHHSAVSLHDNDC